MIGQITFYTKWNSINYYPLPTTYLQVAKEHWGQFKKRELEFNNNLFNFTY